MDSKLTSVNRSARIGLTLLTIAAAGIPAGALAHTIKQTGGWLNPDGSIAVGSGFSASHDGTGRYTVTFPQGSFAKPPLFACAPAGISGTEPICLIYSYVGQSGGVAVQFRIYTRSDGSPEDNSFQFVEVTAR